MYVSACVYVSVPVCQNTVIVCPVCVSVLNKMHDELKCLTCANMGALLC